MDAPRIFTYLNPHHSSWLKMRGLKYFRSSQKYVESLPFNELTLHLKWQSIDVSFTQYESYFFQYHSQVLSHIHLSSSFSNRFNPTSFVCLSRSLFGLYYYHSIWVKATMNTSIYYRSEKERCPPPFSNSYSFSYTYRWPFCLWFIFTTMHSFVLDNCVTLLTPCWCLSSSGIEVSSAQECTLFF